MRGQLRGFSTAGAAVTTAGAARSTARAALKATFAAANTAVAAAPNRVRPKRESRGRSARRPIRVLDTISVCQAAATELEWRERLVLFSKTHSRYNGPMAVTSSNEPLDSSDVLAMWRARWKIITIALAVAILLTWQIWFALVWVMMTRPPED